MKPMLLINLKTYEQGTGKNALALAKAAEAVARKRKANVVLSVQPTDLRKVAAEVGIPVYAQHVDPIKAGSHTGWVLPEAVKEAGAAGTLVNHSERNVPLKKIGETVARCKELGLVTVCCADTPLKAGQIARFLPDFIAIEPPELIGGKVSVATAKPEVIEQTVDEVKKVDENIIVLCGAGVNSEKDVRKAIELGAAGVLVASAVVKSGNPRKAIEELLGGF